MTANDKSTTTPAKSAPAANVSTAAADRAREADRPVQASDVAAQVGATAATNQLPADRQKMAELRAENDRLRRLVRDAGLEGEVPDGQVDFIAEGTARELEDGKTGTATDPFTGRIVTRKDLPAGRPDVEDRDKTPGTAAGGK